MARRHWVGFLEEGSDFDLDELSRILGVSKQNGAGPKAPFPVGPLKEKKTFGDPISKGVPELVLKAELGADETPRHKGATGEGSGAASKLSARSQEDAGLPMLDRRGVGAAGQPR